MSDSRNSSNTTEFQNTKPSVSRNVSEPELKSSTNNKSIPESKFKKIESTDSSSDSEPPTRSYTVDPIHTIAQFKTIITGSDLIVIDFYSDWCPPCRMIAPYIEQFAKIYKNVRFHKINTSNAELKPICEACKIGSIPSFCYFHSGICLKKVVGANKEEIEENIKLYENWEKN